MLHLLQSFADMIDRDEREHFVVFGSVGLVLHGIDLGRPIGDLDLFVSSGSMSRLSRRFEPRTKHDGKMFVRVLVPHPDIEIVDYFPGVAFSEVKSLASENDRSCGFRFGALEHLVTWKRTQARPKDLSDLRAVERSGRRAHASGARMIRPWTILRSRVLVNDRWITLRSDVCRREDGLDIDPFYVVERPEWVCVLAITEDRSVVLTREYRHGAKVVGVGLPGGTVEPGDPDPAHAARRELLEETGFETDEFLFMGARYANWANQTNRVHYFLASNVKRVRSPDPDASEQIEVLLAPLHQVMDPQFLQQSFHLACVHLALPYLRDPGGGRAGSGERSMPGLAPGDV